MDLSDGEDTEVMCFDGIFQYGYQLLYRLMAWYEHHMTGLTNSTAFIW